MIESKIKKAMVAMSDLNAEQLMLVFECAANTSLDELKIRMYNSLVSAFAENDDLLPIIDDALKLRGDAAKVVNDELLRIARLGGCDEL